MESNVLSAAQMQSYLELNLNAAVRFEFQADRVQVRFLDFPEIKLNKNQNFSVDVFEQLDTSIARNDYFEKIILPALPQLLLRRLWPLIHHSADPNGQIFVQIQKGKSFVLLSYFYEQKNLNDYVTSYLFFPLPCQKRNNHLYEISIQNVSIEIGSVLLRESQDKADFECQNLFMEGSVLESQPTCQLQQTKVSPVTQSWKMDQGALFLFHDCTKLHFACQNKPAETLALEHAFNLFLISKHCALSATFKSGQTWSRQAEHSQSLNFDFLHILHYNPSDWMSSFEKNRIVIGILAGITAFIAISITFMFGLIWWWRRRYGLQISIQELNDGPSHFEEDKQVVTYQASPKVDGHIACPQDNKTQSPLPGKVTKSAVELAIDEAANLAQCTVCAADPPQNICNPKPFYGTSASRLGSIRTLQTGNMSASPRLKPTNFHISRLSLDSAWSYDENCPSSSPQGRLSLSPPPSPLQPPYPSLVRSNVATRFPLEMQQGKPDIGPGQGSPLILPSTLFHLDNNIKQEAKQACKPAQH